MTSWAITRSQQYDAWSSLFQVPVKSSTQNMNDSLFYSSQTATQSTQDRPLGQDIPAAAAADLDNLFEGLDEDSIFGDFEDAD